MVDSSMAFPPRLVVAASAALLALATACGADSIELPGLDAATDAADPGDDAGIAVDSVVSPPPVATPAAFSLVVLPDTQYYALHYPELALAQTAWIRQNKDREQIAFVLHEGDLTDKNSPAEWENALAAMQQLDGVVPYALAVGNHDMGPNGESATRDISLFDATFPVSHFESLPTFGGTYEPQSIANSYHTFEAGGVEWLILVLEFGPRDAVLSWANEVVTAHPERQVILLTHSYLYYDDTLHGSKSSHAWTPGSYPFADLPGGAADGVAIWNDLVRPHASFSFVLNGHIAGDAFGRKVSTAAGGNLVYQLLANYQFWNQGGDGWLRIMRFDPARRSVAIRTYSPTLDRDHHGAEQRFDLDDLAFFAELDTTPPRLEAVETVGRPDAVVVTFNETVERASAELAASYTIDGGEPVVAATLRPDGKTVDLTTSGLRPGEQYTLRVQDVTDRASARNAIGGAGAEQRFTCGNSLLAEGFDDGQMDGWTIVDDATENRQLLEEWYLGTPSDWLVVDRRLEQRSNIYSGTAATVSNRKGTFAYWNSPAAAAWQDYTLSVTMQSSDDDAIGVLFRYRDPLNYYKVELDSQRSFRKLLLVQAGQELELAQQSGGYASETPITLEVAVEGSSIEVRLAGKTLFGGPVVDPHGGPAAGTIALYCWGAEGTAFDDVQVTATAP